jgi:hypothetical protein
MRFGFFDQLPCPPGFTEQQRFQGSIAQIELKRDHGMDEFICYFNQGGLMPPAMVRESMTRFATDVIPHCR